MALGESIGVGCQHCGYYSPSMDSQEPPERCAKCRSYDWCGETQSAWQVIPRRDCVSCGEPFRARGDTRATKCFPCRTRAIFGNPFPADRQYRGMTEKQFAATVINMARAVGWIVGYTHDSRKSEPGEPDLRMVRPPRVIFAELKTAKGRLSKGRPNLRQTRWLPGQDDWLDALNRCPGVECYLWRPADLDRIERILREGGW